jgi:hypothetical protein
MNLKSRLIGIQGIVAIPGVVLLISLWYYMLKEIHASDFLWFVWTLWLVVFVMIQVVDRAISNWVRRLELEDIVRKELSKSYK